MFLISFGLINQSELPSRIVLLNPRNTIPIVRVFRIFMNVLVNDEVDGLNCWEFDQPWFSNSEGLLLIRITLAGAPSAPAIFIGRQMS